MLFDVGRPVIGPLGRGNFGVLGSKGRRTGRGVAAGSGERAPVIGSAGNVVATGRGGVTQAAKKEATDAASPVKKTLLSTY